MLLSNKYIWIREVDQCHNGDVGKLIDNAKEIGIDGYIIKTHDGSNFWYQSDIIPELKKAGLSVGAWGYVYGRNIAGEISAIKKSLLYEPDFYVLDVEAEFEADNMRSAAEEISKSIKGTGITFGYTSFAIPSFHSVPFDILSKYCEFTMPQMHWALIGWDVKKTFETSLDEYKKYNIPVYPTGQITSDVTPEDIQAFMQLCNSNNIPTYSFWDYQHATDKQLNAIKDSSNALIKEAIDLLRESGIINTPEYWLENALPGKTVRGDYAELLIQRMAEKIRKG